MLASDTSSPTDSLALDAANALADCYLSLGNIESALYWYKKSDMGNVYTPIAEAFHFGSGKVEKNIQKAIEWYEKGVKEQEKTSITRLAEIYFEGKDGVEQNVEKALQLYLTAEELSDRACLEKIGNIYFKGDGGVQKDLKKALFYYERAYQTSEQNANCIRVLIGFYSGELGEEFEDDRKAIELHERMSEQSLIIVTPRILKAYKNVAQQIEKENILKAIKYYEIAARFSNEEACFRLSEIFEQGIGGIEKSPERAAYWRGRLEYIKQKEYERYMEQMRLREEEEEKKEESAVSKKPSFLDILKRSGGQIDFSKKSVSAQESSPVNDPLKDIVGIFHLDYKDTFNAWFRIPEETRLQYKIEYTPEKGYCVTPF